MRWIGALAAIASLAGCFDSKLTYCDNGAICPETLACTERTETPCGEEQDVEACRGLADRTACTSSARPIGTCASGVCSACVPEYVECRFPEWKPMASPTAESLTAIWAVADDDVYAGGSGPTVVHYDGTAWSMLPAPPTGFAITGLWASAAGDVVVVVQDGGAFHFAGGAWTSLTPPANGGLFGLWGTKLDELFTVGGAGTILRYDSSGWTAMTSNTTRTLSAIWGTSATTLVAAGAAGTIQQYSGANWQPAPSTPLTGLTLRGVWTSGTRLVAVGNNQNVPTMGITATKEAAAWNTQTTTSSLLAGVWGRADDDIYAVGDGGMITHFNGATWMPMTSSTTSALNAVGGTTDNVFAVGDAGTILRYSPAP